MAPPIGVTRWGENPPAVCRKPDTHPVSLAFLGCVGAYSRSPHFGLVQLAFLSAETPVTGLASSKQQTARGPHQCRSQPFAKLSANAS